MTLGFVSGASCGACHHRSKDFSRGAALCERRHAIWRASASDSPKRAKRVRVGVLAAIAVAASTLTGGLRGPPLAQATASTMNNKEMRYDGQTELGGGEKMLSIALTGGAFAGLSAWAWRRNREDDDLEQIRIKEEVERLEKLKAEFMNVEEDDDSIDDEDMYKELSKRLEDAENSDDDDGAGNDDDEEEEKTSTTKAASDAAAGADKKAGEAENGAESLDMLRRMWEATDEEGGKGEARKSGA